MDGSGGPIDVFCRVVDNHGDIGVAWRLARSLATIAPRSEVRLIVDDLGAFAHLAPGLDTEANVQRLDALTVIRWDFGWEGFRLNPARAVVETFGNGMPDRYLELLFETGDSTPKQVVDLEYLSAEPWVEDYHLLPCPTPVSNVGKIMFMPGFRPGTGGLVHDGEFMEKKRLFSDATIRMDARREFVRALETSIAPALRAGLTERFWVTVFTYAADFEGFLRGLSGSGLPIAFLVAPGAGAGAFFTAFDRLRLPFPAVRLPFVPQRTFDTLLLCSDFLVVRGEESLSRAALAGIPFLWQTYPLPGKEHLPKTEALLRLIGGHCGDVSIFGDYESLFRRLNDAVPDENGGIPATGRLLENLHELAPGFRALANSVETVGDLASNLLSFFSGFV